VKRDGKPPLTLLRMREEGAAPTKLLCWLMFVSLGGRMWHGKIGSGRLEMCVGKGERGSIFMPSRTEMAPQPPGSAGPQIISRYPCSSLVGHLPVPSHSHFIRVTTRDAANG
jgi:hypothetical protein